MKLRVDIKEIASKMKISLSKDDEEKYTSEIEDILDNFKKIEEVDVENIEPLFSPAENLNSFREDIKDISLNRIEVMKNAPLNDGVFFKSPKVNIVFKTDKSK
ncbi:MAG: Asp-tRNA(Asn)/Glu-tRNA(Gln) amidotransferase subunit GatC [Melioribacteraceae bacterium]|nr:Asp-tRNA(Asn)/Glu-tRNA(Gln) amidotransferase subunit GatC [Melioribacteraceae bacterium]MCF8355115.1 Asp-tRNA(Asn)/Glu-tRNA(Gln) amidotransferase subunit GatC [Melioribacteraceae bacterium]MCF8392408.1 Asp-tRNA(Asn)/Glu-tRNA(Gln) amidotransferase subunit GatC [Melioribacteraceae bacterium]MCF8417929.1 Asp-tRNA(Asn)/Glu-tRNA(Gln) amidotransferase subunit GatC [Melioribacteraceae bacterium]